MMTLKTAKIQVLIPAIFMHMSSSNLFYDFRRSVNFWKVNLGQSKHSSMFYTSFPLYSICQNGLPKVNDIKVTSMFKL